MPHLTNCMFGMKTGSLTSKNNTHYLQAIEKGTGLDLKLIPIKRPNPARQQTGSAKKAVAPGTLRIIFLSHA